MSIIVIAGATGFVASEIVAHIGDGHYLIGLSRRTQECPPHFNEMITFDEFFKKNHSFDIMVNCAVVNNNSKHSIKEFYNANVSLALRLAEATSLAEAKMVQLSSIHALDLSNETPYAASKRCLSKKILSRGCDNVYEVYLGTVYGRKFSGRLRFLNNFPESICQRLLVLARAFKPMVHVKKLTSLIEEIIVDNQLNRQIILTDSLRKNWAYSLFSASLNCFVCLGTLVVFSWLLVFISILVQFFSSGPVIFRQTRHGKNGLHFTCYKFRTMKTGTVQVGSHLAPNANITQIGKTLRRTKLDELPQCFNILRREMQFIGPRPCLPSQVELITEREKLGVNNIMPGITGYSQVRQVDMSQPELLAKTDAEYLGMRCIALDIQIVLQTFKLLKVKV